MKKYLFLLLVALCTFGCNKQHVSMPTLEPKVVKSVDILSDSSYFSEITLMKYHGNRIYACCMERAQILCMDNEFKLHHTIGRKGRANNELMTPSSFDINKNMIAVYCYGTFKHYTLDGKFLGTTDISQSFPNKNFSWYGNNYYYTSSNGSPIISLSGNGTSRSFGEFYQFETKEESRYRNARFTLIYKDMIITVSDNLPYIELFDRQTLKSIQKVDYSDVDLEDRIVKKNASEQLAVNQYRTLVSNCNISDGKLYVLLADNNLDGFLANKIIVFDIKRNCLPVSILQLPGERYFSFCVDGKIIYAFNLRENTFEKMKI